MNTPHTFIPFEYPVCSDQEIELRAAEGFELANKRRSIREFSDRPVSASLIANLIRTASTAPSGAHMQPWTFCAVANPEIKRAIRQAAEKEEYENYHGRMSEAWLRDLQPFATDWYKPFLEIAHWLIVVFKRLWEEGKDGEKRKNYYVSESVGIACGLLINAIHQAGLVTLTHTPSPMNFLQEILQRPENERAYLLLPVGFPASGAQVPALQRKPIADVMTWYV